MTHIAPLQLDDRAEIDFSVVVADLDSSRTIEASVSAMQVACAGLRAEILVIGQRASGAASLNSRHPQTAFCTISGNALVPDLWAAGIELAKGKVVAFSTGHMIVGPTWARALTAALAPLAAGAGGPIDLMPETSAIDWAIFYLRYSAFLEWRSSDGSTASEIPGDNAAYWRSDLQRYRAGHRGFWEVELHRLLKAEGRALRAVPEACARMGPSYRFSTFVAQRLKHGRHYGNARAQEDKGRRVALIVGAPLVPLVLAWRAARRVWADATHKRRFLMSLPAFLVFAGAWALGEAIGALIGDGRPIATSAARDRVT